MAANEKDEAIGYIYCAENYAAYQERFNEKYLPKLKKLGYFKWYASLAPRPHATVVRVTPIFLHAMENLDNFPERSLNRFITGKHFFPL